VEKRGLGLGSLYSPRGATGRAWAVATANERARAGVMGGGKGDVGVDDVIRGRGKRGKRGGSSGRGQGRAGGVFCKGAF
jgi:hypothetical protein